MTASTTSASRRIASLAGAQPVRLTFESPLGTMVLAATPHGLTGSWFAGQKHAPDWTGWTDWTDAAARDTHQPAPDPEAVRVLQTTAQQLHAYYAGNLSHFDLPLDFKGGTVFQQQVWNALLHIPCGTTTSYAELSRKLGMPTAARAVAAAIGRNPLSIVVPCHRVVGSNGALTGYAGGLDRKRALLQIEGALPS